MKPFPSLLLLVAALAMILPQSASAQNATVGATPPAPSWLWTGNFQQGTVKVHMQRITSVSFSRYTVEGGFRVTELVIDTYGNNSIRIYAVENAVEAAGTGVGQTAIGALQDKVQTAANHAASVVGGGDALSDLNSTMVMKKYPEATHAHTVEYRLPKPKDVYDAYQSVDGAWESGHGSTYSTDGAPLVIQ